MSIQPAAGYIHRRTVHAAGAALLAVWAVASVMPRRSAAAYAEATTVPIHPGLHYYEPVREKPQPEKLSVEICVYGGTSGGVVAAVQAARDGRSVLLVAPEAHLGGLTTGGLTNTDIGNKGAIGGLSREFYRRVGYKYGIDEEWRFEPKVAEQVYGELIREARVPVRTRHFLKSVQKEGRRIKSLTTERGLTVEARVFIDATYEGDLMARAGVRYHVGREANSVHNETLNGIQLRDKHQFEAPVSPYVVEGDPASGLLPGINPEPVAPNGTGDHRVQAYNFRMTLTTIEENRIPFAKPEGYDPQRYVLLARYLKTGWSQVFNKFDPIRGNKVDTNNHGAVSTDNIGMNYAYPDADYAARERIFREHVVYQQGWLWFLANDPSVPETIRTKMSQWGLCKDEFQDTGGWPRQLYVREARRMISDYVMTEHNCRGTTKAEDPVGLAAYTMDSHNCQRVVVDGRAMNEGDVQVGGFPPYPISYRSIVPKRAECENLFVPVCLSASHIAYGSIRMEPVFMILGQSVAVAAGFALDGDRVVQNVDGAKLRARLLELGQILEWKGGNAGRQVSAAPAVLSGIVLDDADGKKTGTWSLSSRSDERRIGTGYIHDDNSGKGEKAIEYAPDLPADGEYEIFLVAPPNPNRASNVPVTIAVEGQEPVTVRVDQRLEEGNGFRPLGRFRLPKGRKTTVTVSNHDTDGYVVADGVQFVPR
jgi:FAD-dependent oxidoreductase family protein